MNLAEGATEHTTQLNSGHHFSHISPIKKTRFRGFAVLFGMQERYAAANRRTDALTG
ncbi:hypothetical protein [Candidatus Pantoea floridensis]|uniref:hypothetical protein n=1 Tax=Candidatus Pantoea floridensis TaxID=1938870 RepID=UPI0015969DF4|nr:hypothetical protein [Pantoea floridensis]